MNFQHIGTERVDPLPFSNDTPPDDISATIILIEKAHPSCLPLVYRCQHDNLPYLERDHFLVEKEAFQLIGEMVELDKQKKSLLLRTGNSVFYKYLVTVSSPAFLMGTEQQQEFSAALNSLIDALRLQNKVLPAPSAKASTESIAIMHELKRTAETTKVPEKVSDAMLPTNAGVAGSSNPGKCLFEFQL